MTAIFSHEIGAATVLLRLRKDGRVVPPAEWAVACDGQQLAAASTVLGASEAGDGTVVGDALELPARLVSGLANRQAEALGLPAYGPFGLELVNEGTFDQPTFSFRTNWRRQNGAPVVGAERRGAVLRVGERWHRLPPMLFRIADLADRFNATSVEDPDARLRMWAALQAELPEGSAESLKTTGYLAQLRIAYAGAFSLDVTGDLANVDFDPVLHAGRPRPELTEQPEEEGTAKSLLPPDYQKIFARDRFRRFDSAHASYALGNGWYVVVAPAVQKALTIVRQAQRANPSVRREFLRNPRVLLREALQDDYDEQFIEGLLIETSAYSERVRNIGIWQPQVVPWLAVPREPWLPPPSYGLMVGDTPVNLSLEATETLRGKIQEAIAAGEPHVIHDGVQIPATTDTIEALNKLTTEVKQISQQPRDDAERTERTVLLIDSNFGEEDDLFEVALQPRHPALPSDLPDGLHTQPKDHQTTGIEWLQKCWLTGRPGALLADDMGLGKTFQALAFLAWLRDGMRRHGLPTAPMLVVAPTGLLANWLAEHDRHLAAPGLGQVLKVYGADLKGLRQGASNDVKTGVPVLDETKLRAADWILTTYETLRDYQHSFGRIPFSIVVFDEAQRIKTPGVMVTDAAKAMKAAFVLTMTGTPIENRLADLWCILDATHPGLLGDLKGFSRTYEAKRDDARLGNLKERLTGRGNTLPPIMLRRLKADSLKGLPGKQEREIVRTMPGPQAAAYGEVVLSAQQTSGMGAMLRTIQELRRISLHPFAPGELDDASYIAASARFMATFDTLDEIAAKREKVLIFLESLDLQPYVAALIMRRYRLAALPMIISGEVGGMDRQKRVDQFQKADPGFDAMILSPRAGGVGLTLTAANHVIHLTRWWNPAVEDQCTDRTYRIGQEKPVQVHLPLALLAGQEEFSFDRRLHELLGRKRELSRDLLVPPGPSDADAEHLYRGTVEREL